jgi:nitrate/nitrite transporter NarK
MEHLSWWQVLPLLSMNNSTKFFCQSLLADIAEAEVGVYSLGWVCSWFCIEQRILGIEPFFFSHSDDKNAPQTYAMVTKYFVIFGSFILLSVIVFADLFNY